MFEVVCLFCVCDCCVSESGMIVRREKLNETELATEVDVDDA